MADGLQVGNGIEIPLSEVELRTSRSSGPGGQHANVTASRVEAVFEVDASSALSEAQRRRLKGRFGPRVTAVAQDARGQARNRDLALKRLRERIEAGLQKPKRRRATKPTTASKARRLESKRRRADVKRQRRRPGGDD